MSQWRWVSLPVILAIHDRQIAEHGGLDGLRDPNGLQSSIARPLQLASYEQPDAAELAAAYLWGMTRNDAFSDGNKRTAWIAARLFLADNGKQLEFDRNEAVRFVEAASAGTLSEAQVVAWFRERIQD